MKKTGRPSKEEQQKRENIKNLKLFKRDSYMYRILENVPNDIAPYLFCRLSEMRSKNPHQDNDVLIDKEKNIKFLTECSFSKNNEDFINEYKQIDYKKVSILRTIDKKISDYFQLVWYDASYKIFCEIEIVQKHPYEMETKILRETLNEILGKKHVDEILKSVYRFFSDNNKFIILEKIHSKLNKDDKLKIHKYFKKKLNVPKTIIHNRMNYKNIATGLGTYEDIVENNVYLELDFSKPLEDILKIVTKIKNDFDNNPKTVQNVFGLLDVDINNSSFNDLELYSTSNTKTLSGRLSDILFVYDCKKIGLDNEFIIDEITEYWNETPFQNRMTASTLTKYHEIAKTYINEKKYKLFLSGLDTKTLF